MSNVSFFEQKLIKADKKPQKKKYFQIKLSIYCQNVGVDLPVIQLDKKKENHEQNKEIKIKITTQQLHCDTTTKTGFSKSYN